METGVLRTGPIAASVAAARTRLADADAVRRLYERDATLWDLDPARDPDRLGWLTSAGDTRAALDELEALRASCLADGLTDVLVLGMGGSSLFPLVIAEVAAGGSGADDAMRLHVLDSSDPAAVRRVTDALPLERTLVVASSKSGTTLETTSLLAWFAAQVPGPDRIVVITDPGSPLAGRADSEGYRRAFLNAEDVGGRTSALSLFGMVPAVLAGADVRAILDGADAALAACGPDRADEDNPAVMLAATLAGGAEAGRDELTLIVPGTWTSFAGWIEQLVAESLGKDRRGVLPVVGEPHAGRPVAGPRRLFVEYGDDPSADALVADGEPVLHLPAPDPTDLGAEVIRWSAAVALAGVVLGVDPFDQPDVEAAKRAARAALDEAVAAPEFGDPKEILDARRPGEPVHLLAYVDPEGPAAAELDGVRQALRDQLDATVTVGIGPRYLHSTGQLHKGGPTRGVFLVALPEHDQDVPIPGQEHTFGQLERAQALGDVTALTDAGQRVGLVRMADLLALG